MNICMYLRKSRTDADAEARGEGETLARHETTLLEIAKKQKLTVGAIYRELVSGETIAARPVMQNLLSEIEQGLWQGVLVMEIERLARGATIDQGIIAQTFKFSNTKIITPTKTYDPLNEFDEEYFEFGLFMSRREYKTINRRIQAGRLASSKEGRYVGNVPPYGYTRKKIEKGFTLSLHPEQSEIVKQIFQLYTQERKGVGLICRHLNCLGVTASKGVWVVSSVRDILRNPVYMGKIKWMSRPQKKKMKDGVIITERPRAKPEDVVLVEGLHPPIIDEQTFVLTQNLLALNPSRPCPTAYETKSPLAGLMVCGECGRKMVRRPYKKKGQSASLMCPLPGCPTVSAPLDIVESVIVQTLAQWMSDYSIEPKLTNTTLIDVEAIYKANAKTLSEIENTEKQLEAACELLEKGVYSVELFTGRSKKLKDQIDKLKSKIQEIPKTKAPDLQKTASNYYELETAAQKNDLLKQVIAKIIYNKKTKKSPDAFTLDIFPLYSER